MIYFGQFNNVEGDTLSVILGNKSEVDEAKVDQQVVFDITKKDYQVPIHEDAIDCFGFNYDKSLANNQIIIPEVKTSMLEENESCMNLGKNTTPPNIRFDITGYKAEVDATGEITYTEVTLPKEALTISYVNKFYSPYVTGFDSFLTAWQVMIDGVSFPDNENFYQVKIDIQYEGFNYQDELLAPAWRHIYYLKNTEFRLPNYYSIKASPDQYWSLPDEWESVVSSDPRVAGLVFTDDVELYIGELGECLLTFVEGGILSFCKVESMWMNYIGIDFADDPITIETKSEKGLLSPYKGTNATVRLLSKTPMFDLLSDELNSKTVKIFKNNDLIFYGYITPNIYSQEYSNLDTIELECVDLLSALDNEYVSEYITDYVYQEFNELIKYSMENIAGHVCDYVIPEYYVINQVKIHNNVAIDEDFTFLEVLTELCHSLGLTMTYYNDVLYFLDLQTKNTIYVRHHDDTFSYVDINDLYDEIGIDDISLDMEESHKNISVVQKFNNINTINIIGSDSINRTYGIEGDRPSYSYWTARENRGSDTIIHKAWMQFYDSPKFPLKRNAIMIRKGSDKYLFDSIPVTDYGRVNPPLVDTFTMLSINPIDPIYGVPNKLISVHDGTRKDDYSKYNQDIRFRRNVYYFDEHDWRNNGLGGDGHIEEISCSVRYQETTRKEYIQDYPSSNKWEEMLFFTSFGIDHSAYGYSYRCNENTQTNKIPYKAAMPIYSETINLDNSQYMLLSGKVKSDMYFPCFIKHRYHLRNIHNNNISLIGLDSNVLFKSSDGHYFVALQNYIKSNNNPNMILTTQWQEITESVYNTIIDPKNNTDDEETFSYQLSNDFRIPVNLNDNSHHNTSEFYSFSDNANWFISEGEGFCIPLPYYTDDDAPEINHPWGDDHDASELYSKKSNVIDWLPGTDPTTISKEGQFVMVCLGSAYGGMNYGNGNDEFRYTYLCLKDLKIQPKPSALTYFDVLEGSVKDNASIFTYNYNKKDYDKYEDVDMYYHSNNEYLSESSNNTILVNNKPIESAPDYMITGLELSKGDSLETALVQKHYNQVSKPRLKFEQTIFNDGLFPYSHADILDRKLYLDSQERNLKRNQTRVSMIELGQKEIKVIPINKKRKR